MLDCFSPTLKQVFSIFACFFIEPDISVFASNCKVSLLISGEAGEVVIGLVDLFLDRLVFGTDPRVQFEYILLVHGHDQRVMSKFI